MSQLQMVKRQHNVQTEDSVDHHFMTLSLNM